MEEIDGMFSSPEKSPARENGFGDVGDETSMGSDGMSLDEGRRYPLNALVFEKLFWASG